MCLIYKMSLYFSLILERLIFLDIFESELMESVYWYKININIFIFFNVLVLNMFCFIFWYLLEMKKKNKK